MNRAAECSPGRRSRLCPRRDAGHAGSQAPCPLPEEPQEVSEVPGRKGLRKPLTNLIYMQKQPHPFLTTQGLCKPINIL